jgi:hypothetical protein
MRGRENVGRIKMDSAFKTRDQCLKTLFVLSLTFLKHKLDRLFIRLSRIFLVEARRLLLNWYTPLTDLPANFRLAFKSLL